MVQAARLVVRGRHRVWTCPTCGRTLGEVYDDNKVVIKAGDRIIVHPMNAGVEQLCPRCGTVSTAVDDDAA